MARYFPNETISKIHGTARKRENMIYFPMYHPAAALHQGNLRATIEADMLKIPQILSEVSDDTQTTSDPQQLNLF
jgi:DNA polymerase